MAFVSTFILIAAFLMVDAKIRMTNHSHPIERIVGGKYVKIHKFPYQVFIDINGEYDCGGSIISPHHILTAAHCIVGYENVPERVRVRSGSSSSNQGGQVSRVTNVIRHENYARYPYMANDIALLLLSKKLTYDINTQEIPLIPRLVKAGEDAVVSGWGDIDDIGSVSVALKALRVRMDYAYSCQKAYHAKIGICAYVTSPGSICRGDSGGPLAIEGYLAGIASSAAVRCGSTDLPMLFTSVWHYRKWIQRNIETYRPGNKCKLWLNKLICGSR